MQSSLSLEGKKVLVIGSDRGPRSIDVLRAARKTGVTLYVALCPVQYSVAKNLLDVEDVSVQSEIHFLVIPLMRKPLTSEREQIVAAIISSALEVCSKNNFTFDACVTFQDNWVDYAPLVQKKLLLPGFDSAGVDATSNKLLFREKLREAGLGRAHAMNLEDFLSSESTEATTMIQYPLILKPTFGVGSAGVFLCYSRDDLITKYNDYLHEHGSKYHDWMVEEFLAGPELGVELIMSRGECIFHSIMECEKTPPPIFQGLGRFYPCNLDYTRQCEVSQECIKAAKFLRLDDGVVDMDVKYIDGRGPIILEINSRMGGNSVGFMHHVVFGVDLVEQVLRCGCRMSNASEIQSQTNAAYAKLILADYNGTMVADIDSQKFTERLVKALPADAMSHLTSARCIVMGGASVFGGEHEIPSILGVVISTGDTLVESQAKAKLLHYFGSRVLNSFVVPLIGQNESLSSPKIASSMMTVDPYFHDQDSSSKAQHIIVVSPITTVNEPCELQRIMA